MILITCFTKTHISKMLSFLVSSMEKKIINEMFTVFFFVVLSLQDPECAACGRISLAGRISGVLNGHPWIVATCEQHRPRMSSFETTLG